MALSEAEASIVYVNSKGLIAGYQNMYLEFENVDPDGTYRNNLKKTLSILIMKISTLGGGSLLMEIVRDIERTLAPMGVQELAFCKNFLAETIVVS